MQKNYSNYGCIFVVFEFFQARKYLNFYFLMDAQHGLYIVELQTGSNWWTFSKKFYATRRHKTCCKMKPHLTFKYAFLSVCSIQMEIIEEILNPQRHLIMYCWDYFLLSENLLYHFILFIARVKVYTENRECTQKQLWTLIISFIWQNWKQ